MNRALSPLERWFWILEELSPLNVVARVRVHGELPELRPALDALQSRHPLLRVAIETDAAGRDPRFVPTGAPIPLRIATGTDWVTETNERELADRIDWRTGPLCRVTIVPTDGGCDLLVTVSHIISDAVTALSLTRQLLENSGPAEPARPAPEAMFPGGFRLWPILRQSVPDLVRQRWRRPMRLAPSTPVTGRRTRFVHRSLDPGPLVEACRREHTTVHGLLAAAMLTAIAREEGAPRVAVIGSPINFRDALGISDREVGAYVATVASFVDYQPLWPMARAVSADLARRRKRGDHYSTINQLRLLCPQNLAAAGKFLKLVEAGGPGNICLSNIGRHDFPDTIGGHAVSGAQYVSGLSASGYLAALVNTSHGRLSWNFAYIEEAIPTARAERLATASVDLVLAAVGQPVTTGTS